MERKVTTQLILGVLFRNLFMKGEVELLFSLSLLKIVDKLPSLYTQLQYVKDL